MTLCSAVIQSMKHNGEYFRIYVYTHSPNYAIITFRRVWRKTNPSYRGADKSLAPPGRKQARKHVREARDFNNIETRAAIKFPFPQGKAPKEIHAILTETLACFLPGRAKDLSAPLSMWSTVHVYRRESIWNTDLNTLEPDGPQHDRLWYRPAVFFLYLCLIALSYP